jgi:secreted trypsin-like serine protease
MALAVLETAGCATEVDATGAVAQTIIGGESTDPGEYPATGALIRGRSYRCTATLIAPDVAITAAHCMEEGGWGDFGFTLDADLTVTVDDIVPVLLYHKHPDFVGYDNGKDYTKMGQRNDVAIIILDEPILDVPVERMDTANDADDLPSGAELTLCGYGRDHWSVPTTAGRKRDGVVYVDRATSWELQTIDEDPQPCKGDSGGPLFRETEDGRVIAGLVSRASGLSHMCDSGAIYTRVATYTDWVERASLDRDTGGCSAGASRTGWWLVLLAWIVLPLRARRRPRGRI